MTGHGLRRRDTVSRELMDDPECDPDRLLRTYRQFAVVNRLLSGWRRLYRQRIRPTLRPDRPTTLLDIGFGGGDIPRLLLALAHRDGLDLHVTAIDPDERAVRYADSLPRSAVVHRQAASADLVTRGERFDFVISNHLLHHLDAVQLDALLADSVALARVAVIHNDLARARLGHIVWGVATLPVARRSFLHQDGLLSIRRSYRPAELRAATPPGWRTTPMFPQRLLLTHEGALDDGRT